MSVERQYTLVRDPDTGIITISFFVNDEEWVALEDDKETFLDEVDDAVRASTPTAEEIEALASPWRLSKIINSVILTVAVAFPIAVMLTVIFSFFS